jgi:hypothetical protein
MPASPRAASITASRFIKVADGELVGHADAAMQPDR